MTIDFAPERLIGRPVWDFFAYLAAQNPQIAEIRFQSYRPAPKLTERLRGQLTASDDELLRRADEIRKPTGIPFWDALLAIAMREGKLDSKIAQAALLHEDNQQSVTFHLSATNLRPAHIQDLLSKLSPGFGLVVCSRVKMHNDSFLHIPMIDLRCPVNSLVNTGVKALLERTGQSTGVLVESGKSYHLYGTRLLRHEDWVRFLAISLLLSPMTDPRFIAHRLADGECRLKVASESNAVPVIAQLL